MLARKRFFISRIGREHSTHAHVLVAEDARQGLPFLSSAPIFGVQDRGERGRGDGQVRQLMGAGGLWKSQGSQPSFYLLLAHGV